jgi:hypothetical protein
MFWMGRNVGWLVGWLACEDFFSSAAQTLEGPQVKTSDWVSLACDQFFIKLAMSKPAHACAFNAQHSCLQPHDANLSTTACMHVCLRSKKCRLLWFYPTSSADDLGKEWWNITPCGFSSWTCRLDDCHPENPERFSPMFWVMAPWWSNCLSMRRLETGLSPRPWPTPRIHQFAFSLRLRTVRCSP